MLQIKTILLTLVVTLFTSTDMNFYDFTMNSIDGTPVELSSYKGKKVLIVNVASKCGYTPQYADLQELHEKYGDKVVILGFPANNFGGQEPGSNLEIASFCEKNYGVSFQMFEKISVKGKDRHPLYTWLAEQSGEEPSWNFCKYLIDENGQVMAFYPSAVNPLDEQITGQL
jgi:glutathione peroxidase